MTLVIGVALTASVGCGARTNLRDRHDAELTISVHNEAAASICEVHIFLAGTSEHGANRLSPNTRIATGELDDFYVPKRDPAETYQVETGGCPDDKRPLSGFAPSVFMNGPARVVVFDEGDPRSKEAAGAIAHANENTTLVPATYSRRTAR